VPLIVIQRQLGQSNLGITSVYLQGIDNAEIIETAHARRAPWSRSPRRGPRSWARGLRTAAARSSARIRRSAVRASPVSSRRSTSFW
jgi:hypothetical protein